MLLLSNTYKNKNIEKSLEEAIDEYKSTNIIYKVIEEKKTILAQNKITIRAISKESIIEITKEIINQIFNQINVDYEVEIIENDSTILNLKVDNPAILIGKDGSTLKSFNNVIKKMVTNKIELNPNIMIDINNYNQKKLDKLITLVKKLSSEVRKTRIDVQITSLSAYERKVVHNYLKDDSEIKTESIGEDPNRILTIKTRD